MRVTTSREGCRAKTWTMSIFFWLALILPSVAVAQEVRFTPAQLREDLAAIEQTLQTGHPDIAHSADPAALSQAIERIRGELDHPMTRDEAWRVFATLNPVLADAHITVMFPGWRTNAQTYLDEGGLYFPFEVSLAEDGKLYVKSLLGGADTPLKGARILSIDGVSAEDVATASLERTHGDTPGFRAALFSDRFWFFHWKLYGEKAEYDVVLEQNGQRIRRHIAGSSAKPEALADQRQFESTFQFSLLPCNAAWLKIDSFYWPDEERYFAFTRNAFETIQKAGVRTLIIDVRDNGGGNDDMWIEGIARYIADKPYRWASGYKKRVIEDLPDEDYEIGEVVSGPLDSWIQPEPDNPLHYSGETYVLIGPRTYSSAVLFSNVVRHFDFATLAGTGGFARPDTTGDNQQTLLPNTGLALGWPRFILYRPSVEAEPEFLEPEIRLDPAADHPRALVDALLRRVDCQPVG